MHQLCNMSLKKRKYAARLAWGLKRHGRGAQRQTSHACSVCGPRSERLYATDRSLQRHLELAHGRAMCSVCLRVRAPGRACQDAALKHA